MLPPFLPVLAADLSTLITFLILTVSFVSWIISWFQDKNPKQVGNRNKPRPRNTSAVELERYLLEMEKKKEGKDGSEAKRPPKPSRPPGSEKKKPRPQQGPVQTQTRSASPAPQNSGSRPVTRLTETRMTTSDLGVGVRSHVASHMEPRNVDSRVERDIDAGVQRDINSNVKRDLGVGLGKDTTLTVQRTDAVHPLMHSLRNPQGVRQAILLAEILNRPKSMR